MLACGHLRYGPNCAFVCKCANGATCDAVTGQCSCSSDWTGPQCRISNGQLH